MPSGRVHATSNVVVMTAALFIPSSVAVKVPIELGLVSGILLSPDLDVDDGYIGLYFLRQIYGLSMLWRIFWWPYAKLIPHRSPLSHWPILGTLGRLLYLGIPVSIICVVLHISASVFASPLWLWWILGLVISDTMHFTLDVVVSGGL